MEADFPRGGKPLVPQVLGKRRNPHGQLEKRATKNSAKFGQKGENKTRLLPKPKSAKFVQDQFDTVWTSNLSEKNITTSNLLALGCITEVYENELKLELVDGFSVIVPSTSVQSSNLPPIDLNLRKRYSIGQLLAVKVVQCKTVAKSSKKVRQVCRGTVDPKEVNENLILDHLKPGQVVMASVKSLEDKGFVVDFGSSATFGFLPFDKCDWTVDPSEPENAYVGYSFLCAVDNQESNSSRVVKLTCTLPTDKNKSAADTSSYHQNQLLPATRLTGRIVKIVSSGLYLSFAQLKHNNMSSGSDETYGFVSDRKLPQLFQTGKATFEVDQQLNCVVTYVCPNTHMIGFSAQNHLNSTSDFFRVKPENLFGNFRVGQKCKALCKLVSKKPNGVYFKLEQAMDMAGRSDGPAVFGYCPAGRLKYTSNNADTEKQNDSARSDLTPNALKYVARKTKHTVRITGYSLITGVLYVGDAARVMEQPILDVEHAKLGTVVEAKVVKIVNNGLKVLLYNSIQGFVSDIFLDNVGENKAKNYPTGSTIKCRILIAQPGKNRLLLTAKKAQVKSSSNNVGPIITSFDKKFVGSVHKGVIVHALHNNTGLLVAFYNNVKGYLNLKADENCAWAVNNFYIGQVVSVRVESVDESMRKMQLVLVGIVRGDLVKGVPEIESAVECGHPAQSSTVDNSERHKSKSVVDESVHPLHFFLSAPVGKIFDASVLEWGSEEDNSEFYLNIRLNKSQLSRVHVSELKDEFQEGENLLTNKQYEPGRVIRVKVIEHRHATFDKKVRIAECSAKNSRLFSRNNKMRHLRYRSDFKQGDLVPVIVNKFKRDACDFVVNPDWTGFCQRADLSTDADVVNSAEDRFHRGQIFHAKVLGVFPKEHRLNLTLLPDDERTVRIGKECVAKVVSVDPGHCINTLMVDGTKGVCCVADLPDNYQHDSTLIDRLNSGAYLKVTPVALSKGHTWHLRIRKDQQSQADTTPLILSFNDVVVGSQLRGCIRKILSKGCVVTLGHTVFAFISMADDESKQLAVGSPVKVKVTSVDQAKGKIKVRLVDRLDSAARSASKRSSTGHGIFDNKAVPKKRTRLSSEQDSEPASLQVEGGFDWSSEKFSMKNLIEVGLTNDENGKTARDSAVDNKNADDVTAASTSASSGAESDGEHSDSDKKKKPKKKTKSKQEKITEREMLQKEMALLNPDRPLQNEEDFDRLLMGSPNNSHLWLGYMALFVQSGEISKVRQVAERALKTIDLKQEGDRFNIWTAMLNLENAYGTTDTLQAVFERARQVNEPLNVYKQLLKIYHRTGKIQEADQLVDEMLKRFKTQFDSWLSAAEHFYSVEPKRPALARQLTARAAKSLSEEHKVNLACRFAQMEFKFGDAERGKTLFEGLVDKFPKRMDLWSVYADMMAKYSGCGEARAIYERVVSMKLPVNKLKSFYQKWMDFERRNGSSESVSQVQQRLEMLFNASKAGDEK